jgi:RecJ-like exonuclease
MRTDGIVTAVRIGAQTKDNTYTILTAEQILTVRCGILLEPGEEASVDTEKIEDSAIPSGAITVVGKTSKAKYMKMLSLLTKKAIDPKGGRGAEYTGKFKATTSSMSRQLGAAAKRFLESYLTGAATIVRFHNDCDGSSGAIGLHMALDAVNAKLGYQPRNISWRMNKSIAYRVDEYYEDSLFLNNYKSIARPLVLASDFGTSPESEGAIRELCKTADMMMLDHHPVYGSFPRELVTYINPWDFGGDSDYTAGMLTCSFADRIVGVNLELLKHASLIGDYSACADRSNTEAQRVAVVLDYLTSKRGEGENFTPKYFGSVIFDREKLAESFLYASTRMSEAIELGVKNIKHYITAGRTNVYVLDFKHVSRSEDDYPLPGRYASSLQRKMEEIGGADVITVVHYGNYISFRLSPTAAKKIELLKIIARLKEESEHVIGGGGHHAAASIRVDKNHVDDVLGRLLQELGA